MNRFLYYIIVVLILLVLFPMGTHAQDIDKLSENKVVTAVTALNSGDIDSAIRLLEASIEMSPENDAAYGRVLFSYYPPFICRFAMHQRKTWLRRKPL